PKPAPRGLRPADLRGAQPGAARPVAGRARRVAGPRGGVGWSRRRSRDGRTGGVHEAADRSGPARHRANRRPPHAPRGAGHAGRPPRHQAPDWSPALARPRAARPATAPARLPRSRWIAFGALVAVLVLALLVDGYARHEVGRSSTVTAAGPAVGVDIPGPA